MKFVIMQSLPNYCYKIKNSQTVVGRCLGAHMMVQLVKDNTTIYLQDSYT
jgi:hypothetical protein